MGFIFSTMNIYKLHIFPCEKHTQDVRIFMFINMNLFDWDVVDYSQRFIGQTNARENWFETKRDWQTLHTWKNWTWKGIIFWAVTLTIEIFQLWCWIN
jgi:hypothetical protein